ncbi:MAG: hypothetical protein E7328_04935 [Clostridiales bacterium]|nr:hypothetical protein [Clostridiales bacterium]
MAIYAIADLHLSDVLDKSMDIFGKHWENHMEKIEEAWLSMIAPEDVVLISGDISWAMKLSDAVPDLNRIARLPGHKYIIRGNHDFWWNSIGKVRGVLPQGLYAIQNDSVMLSDSTALCGTRGWVVPGAAAFDGEDRKIYDREVGRLKLSLDHAKRRNPERIVVMMHYPPVNDRYESNEITALLEEYGVSHLVYGHLHGVSHGYPFEGERNGVQYRLTSCDYLRFKPVLISE